MSKDELELGALEAVDQMSDEQIEAEAKKIFAKRAKQLEYRKTMVLTPEAKAKRTAYRQAKYLREKAILAKAKELGLES
jgi:hypothetical protein